MSTMRKSLWMGKTQSYAPEKSLTWVGQTLAVVGLTWVIHSGLTCLTLSYVELLGDRLTQLMGVNIDKSLWLWMNHGEVLGNVSE